MIMHENPNPIGYTSSWTQLFELDTISPVMFEEICSKDLSAALPVSNSRVYSSIAEEYVVRTMRSNIRRCNFLLNIKDT